MNTVYHNNKWWVGCNNGEEDGRLYNEVWLDFDWSADPELTVTPGELDNCGTLTISESDEYPQCNGDLTQSYWPVQQSWSSSTPPEISRSLPLPLGPW